MRTFKYDVLNNFMFCSKLKIKFHRCSSIKRTAWISAQLHIIHCNKDSRVSSPDVANWTLCEVRATQRVSISPHIFFEKWPSFDSVITSPDGYYSENQGNLPTIMCLSGDCWQAEAVFHSCLWQFKRGSQRNSDNLMAEILKPHI